MNRVAFSLVACACIALASRAGAAPTLPVETPKVLVTPAPSARMRAVLLLQQAQRGVFDRSQFTDVMNQVVTPEVATQIGGQLRPLGAPTSMRFLYTERRGISTLYAYRLTWPSAKLDELMVIDRDQRISGLLFRSAQDPSPAPVASPEATPTPTAAPVPTPSASVESGHFVL